MGQTGYVISRSTLASNSKYEVRPFHLSVGLHNVCEWGKKGSVTMRSASDSKFEVGSYHLGMGLIMHIHLHFLCISWLGEWQNMGHKQPTRCHKEFCCFTFWVLFGHPSSTTLLGNEITVLFPYSRWDFA